MIKWDTFIQNNNCNGSSTDLKIDPVFRKLSKTAICFHIWKVEEDRIESVPKTEYGIFYDDSSYIIYAATTNDNPVNQDTITRELKNETTVQRFIHFWLGSKISQERSANVAYKIMELDTYFGYATTQFRETQDNESSRFLSYFKKGIKIFCGLSNTSPKDCKLFQIKGKISPKCIEQSNISWDYFSSIYSMILKTANCLMLWIGRSTSLTEKRNALKIAEKMKKEYDYTELVIVDDGYEQLMNEMHKYEWNHCLSLKNRFVHEPSIINEQKPKFSIKLYKCGYREGKYRIEEYKSESPEQQDLSDPECVYIIDGASSGVWVWIGKQSDKIEKVEAMRNARGFVKKKKYPSSTPVIRVCQDHEPIEFKRLFPTWVTANDTIKKTKTIISKLDSLTLFQRPKLAADTQLIDDGTGEKHVFRITDGRYNEIINQKTSIFFSNDCYLIHYMTVFSDLNSNNSCIRLIVYFWIGTDVPADVRESCEVSAKKYFENLDKHTMIVKLYQGFETPHFLQMFGGKFIVFNGTTTSVSLISSSASLIPSIHSDINMKIPSKFILKIYGDTTYNSKAFECNSMIVTHSQDRFIIKTNNNLWIWCGQGSTGDAREVAKSIASILGEYTLITESKETEEFLKSISKQIEFKHHPKYQNDHNGNDRLTPPLIGKQSLNYLHKNNNNNGLEIYDKSRASLFINLHIQGNFHTQEILYYDQTDLNPEDIYFLDTGGIIYVWIGSFSMKDERKACWQAVFEFLKNFPIERNQNTTIALVQQHGEPNVFIGYFDVWDRKFWNGHITYDQLRKQIQKTSIQNFSNFVTPTAINGETEFDKYQKYSISVLQQEVDLLPQGVDPIRKEVHLTHDDFVQLFKMKFNEFDALPVWKKQELKKKHKLF